MKGIKQQALQVALYATWLAGLLFIVVSLYATQLLPGMIERDNLDEHSIGLTVTIYTVPEPFEGIVAEIQSQAVYSWLLLSPDLRVVLLGNHLSLKSFADKLRPRVVVESDIDFTFSGAPLFHSVLARACASSSDIAVLIDPQFILLHDFIDTLQYAHNLQHDWLLVAISKSINKLPFQLNFQRNLWVEETSQPVREEQVHAYVKAHGIWSNCSGRYLWAWNAEHVPLHAGVMPSFVYGYGLHHEWLLNEALLSGIRFVFDASDAVLAFYSSGYETNSNFHTGARILKEKSWEADNNAHLAALYGSFYYRPLDFSNTPVKLVRCGDASLKIFRFLYPLFEVRASIEVGMASSPLSGHDSADMQDGSLQQLSNDSFLTSFRWYGLARRQKIVIRYPCQSAEVYMEKKGRTSLKTKLLIGRPRVNCDCSNETEEMKLDCPSSKMKRLPKLMPSRSSLMETAESMPMSLESLLLKVSDVNKIVVLSVVGNSYKDMLMSWVCRLRNLEITSFIVGAVDTELYEFALLQGLPVFMTGPSMNLSFNNCHFGTDCFKKVTKMKSKTVLHILQFGYNVLFSDVDVYWFKSPIEYLMSFGPGTVVAQTDQWNVTEAPNKPRRLNSGFYFTWSEPSTISVFEKIVKHAAASDMSEQPSFYDVLCGESGRYRLGDWQCMEPETNVTTYFLDRDKFPNGAFKGLWERKNVSEACRLQGCFVLHNNWVSGRHKKLGRQISSGLWDYDVKSHICLRSWQGQKMTHA